MDMHQELSSDSGHQLRHCCPLSTRPTLGGGHAKSSLDAITTSWRTIQSSVHLGHRPLHRGGGEQHRRLLAQLCGVPAHRLALTEPVDVCCRFGACRSAAVIAC